MSKKSSMNNNQSIWLKIKSPFGQEQYIPRIIDITAKSLKNYKNQSKLADFFCLFSPNKFF